MSEVDRRSLRESLAALAAAPDDAGARAAVFRELLTGRLLAPLAEADPEAEQPAGVAPGELHMVAMPRDDGVPTALLFTSNSTVRRLGFTGQAAITRLPELWAFLFETGMRSATVDAGGPVAVTLADGDLAALAEGRAPTSDDATAPRAALALPRAPVPSAVAAAVATLAADRDVHAAYLLEGAAWPDARNLFAAIEPAPGAVPEEVLARAWTALAEQAAGDGWRLSATVLDPWEADLIRAASAAEGPARRRREPPSRA